MAEPVSGGSSSGPRSASGRRPRSIGILAALPEELAPLARWNSTGAEPAEVVWGLPLYELELGAFRLVACVGGVGKVNAARATSLLLQRGMDRALLVVGVCGALVRGLGPGDLVHTTRAIQADLALRGEREVEADPALRAAWRAAAPGEEAPTLTADRPALSPWRRLRLARSFRGACAIDMETAAAARVATAAGVPFAALRAVTDGLWRGGSLAFRRHFASQAPRAAESLPALLERL